MASCGPRNPLPHHLGARPSRTEMVWRALRKAVGAAVGGREAAGPVDGIEDQWRLAKARAIARAEQMAEAAALQAIPSRASCHLGVYEDALRVPRAPSDVARRAAVAAAYTEKLGALIPQLRARLQAIDPSIDVMTPAFGSTTEFQFGMHLADRTAIADYGGRVAALLPNFCTHYMLLVRWGSSGGIPDADQRALVERYLNGALPAWCDYIVYTSSRFFLDGFRGSHLGLSLVG